MKKFLFTSTLLAIFYFTGFAQFATLDANFGNAGLDTFSKPHQGGLGNAVAFHSNNKILVTTGGDSLALGRLNYDGSPDINFASNGWVPVGHFAMRSIAIQPDGKILTAGIRSDITYGEEYVWRYNTNGTPDNTFGNNGRIVDTSLGSGYSIVALQSGGKILISGTFAIKRVDSTGVVDATFGNAGYVHNNSLPIFVASMLVEPITGNIILGGYTKTLQHICVMRLTPNGTVDASFATNGIDSLSLPVNALSPYMFVRFNSAGKIVLCSDYGAGNSNKLVCAQFNSTGSLDNSFGNNGLAFPIMNEGNGNEYIGGMDLQSDDKIAITATSNDTTLSVNNYDIRLMRLNANGFVDSAFGTLRVDVGVNGDAPTALGVQPDGKIVIVGSVYPHFLVARVTTGALAVNSITANISTMAIYPNPTANLATLKLTAQENDIVEISICDMQGRIVKQISSGLQIKVGENKQTVSFGEISTGTYIISATGQNTSAHILVQKI